MTETTKPTPRKAPKAKSSRKGKLLNGAEKAEAIALWKAGSTTLDQLSEKFGRARTTFIRLFNTQGISKGENRVENEKKITEAVEAAAVGDIAIIAQRVKETKDEHYKMASGLSKLAWSLIVEARKDNKPFNVITGDLKALKYASDVLKTTRMERYAVLGLDERESNDEEVISDLIVQELTADQVRAMANNKVDEDDLGMQNVMQDLSDADTDDESEEDVS